MFACGNGCRRTRREAQGQTPMMNEHGKSDNLVVPTKPPNNAEGTAAEAVEGRGLAKGNTASTTRPGRSAGSGAPSGLDRVREVARRDKDARFTALLHHVDLAQGRQHGRIRALLQSPSLKWHRQELQ